jgi:hypothetical protein
MEKIIKTAKNFDSMAAACYWTCVVCAGLIAVGAVVFALVPDSVYESITTSLAFGPVHVELNQSVSMTVESSRFRLVGGLIVSDILVLAGIYAAKIVRRILKPMVEGKPFAQSVSKDLRKLAIVSLIAGGFCEISLTVVTAICNNYYDLSQLFNSEMVANVTSEYRIDLWFVVIFCILQLTSYVFRYGEELQQLSDETL